MKKVFLLVALLTWIGFSASAQVEKDTTKKESKMKMDHPKHFWVFKDGKVMEKKDGKSTEMTAETQVGDVWIRPNGEVVMKDNKVVQLKGDEYLNEKGEIKKMVKKMNSERKQMPPPVIE